jgi:hypothetical protein
MSKMILKEKDDRIIEGIDMQEYADSSSFAVYNSKWRYQLGLIVATLFLAIIVYSMLVQKQFRVFGAWFCGFYLTYLIFYYRKFLIDDKPQLVLTKNGIAVIKFGFVPWSAIRLIQIKNRDSGESSSITLDIFLTNKKFENHPDCSVEIFYLNKDTKQIKDQIKEFGKIEPEDA